MKKCIFCNSSEEITKEHIFPEWYRKLDRIGVKKLTHYSFNHPTQRIFPLRNLSEIETKVKSEREYAINSLVNGYVCKKCNNVFLNKIDNNAKSIVTKLLKRDFEEGDFTKENCKALSMWAYKTVLTLCHPKTINFKKLIPDFAYQDSFITREVPDDVLISLGKLGNNKAENTEPLWSINQFFFFEFPRSSHYAKEIIKESTFILNQKKATPPSIVYFLNECNKDSFHVILNLNGILLRIVYVPRTDLFSLRYSEGEIMIHPPLIGKVEDLLGYESMVKFMGSLFLVYKGPVI